MNKFTFTPLYPWEYIYFDAEVTITDEGVQVPGREVESWYSVMTRAANAIMVRGYGTTNNWKRGMTTHTVEPIDYDHYRVIAWGEEYILSPEDTRHFLLTNELPIES